MLMFESDILSHATNGARNIYGYSDEARPPVRFPPVSLWQEKGGN